MSLLQAGSVRKVLAQDTRQAHLALHSHSVLSRWTAADLAVAEYATLISIYHGFYSQVEAERRRFDCFADLRLEPIVEALRSDEQILRGSTAEPYRPELAFDDPKGVLAALYVLHGSRFGLAAMRVHTLRALPAVPQAFLQTPLQPDLWRRLVQTLDSEVVTNQDIRTLVQEADRVFLAFGVHATATYSAAVQTNAETAA